MSLNSARVRGLILTSTIGILLTVWGNGCLKSGRSVSEIVVVDEEAGEPANPDESGTAAGGQKRQPGRQGIISDNRVTLKLYGMSLCPYFAKLVQTLHPIAQSMGQHLELEINYVGTIDGVELKSMHGPPEVQGNIVQLCAHRYSTAKQWLEFVNCQYADVSSFADNWDSCAEQSQIDRAKLDSCVTRGQGRSLLRRSIKQTEADGVTASPMMHLDGILYDKARTETSIGRAICTALQPPLPQACETYPPATEIGVRIITDERCHTPDCNPILLQTMLNRNFDAVKAESIDYSDQTAAELFKRSGFKYLPILIFDESIKSDPETFAQLNDYLIELNERTFAYPVGRTWDPTAEVCDDGVDNTDNGRVDCQDDFCKAQRICRREQQKTVQLFIMSHCPYCTVVLDQMEDVLDTFDKNRREFNFKLEFVGQEVDGDLLSMHGENELIEDLRQICAQHLYPKKYKFMNYVWCRNRAFQQNKGNESPENWRTCVRDGIDAEKIRACAEGPQGTKLLSASFALATELGIAGSPVWLLNNRYEMQARTATQITQAFCAKNPTAKGC